MSAPVLYRCALCHRELERRVEVCTGCGAVGSYVEAPPRARASRASVGMPAPFVPPAAYGHGLPTAQPRLTLVTPSSAPLPSPAAQTCSLADIPDEPIRRMRLNPAMDYVVGGNGDDELGIACGSVVRVFGDPGAGKSTLLMQMLDEASAHGETLTNTREESAVAVRARATRLGVRYPERNRMMFSAYIEDFIDACRALRPVVAVFDSMQVAISRTITPTAGSIPMLKYVAQRCYELAHDERSGGLIVFLVSQVNAAGDPAGAKAAEHWVDTDTQFSIALDPFTGRPMRGPDNPETGEPTHLRALESTGKNRNGPGLRQRLLAMTPRGLVPWEPQKAELPNMGQI